MRINFMNVGEGDMTVIDTGKKIILIDVNISSREDEAYKKLKEIVNTEIIDYLIITHPHNDHIKGLNIIIEDFKVNNIWESGFRFEKEKENEEGCEDYKYFVELMEKSGSKVLTPSSKKLDFIDRDVEFYCLNSKSNNVKDDSSEGIHFNSLVIKMIYNGISVLFTGDSNWKAWEEKVLKNYKDMLNSCILHASHHGSKTFFMNEGSDESELYTEHLEEIEPQYTIISAWTEEEKKKAGKEDFPPHQEAIELYEDFSTEEGGVYITGEEGNLIFDINNNIISLNEEISNKNYKFSKGRRVRIKSYKQYKDSRPNIPPTRMADKSFGGK